MTQIFKLIAYMAAGIIIGGITVAVFWNWFISGEGAAFEGVAPKINVVQALGLSLVSMLLTKNITLNDEDADEEFAKALTVTAVMWVFALLYKSFL